MQHITVKLDFGIETRNVGTLATYKDALYFEYAQEFIKDPLPISPLLQPVEQKLFTNGMQIPFVFADNLPGEWGLRLITNVRGKYSQRLTDLEALRYVHIYNIGALGYYPPYQYPYFWYDAPSPIDPFVAKQLLKDIARTRALEPLRIMVGSIRGATPKVAVTEHHGELLRGIRAPQPGTKWVVRLDNRGEYTHALGQLAKVAGIRTVGTRLFSNDNESLFAGERFDVRGETRLHAQTAWALLGRNAEPAEIMRLGYFLTRKHETVLELFRRAVFGAYTGINTLGAKKVSFVMDHSGQWELAPMYSFTQELYAGRIDVWQLAATAGFTPGETKRRISRVMNKVRSWRSVAQEAGQHTRGIRLVKQALNEREKALSLRA